MKHRATSIANAVQSLLNCPDLDVKVWGQDIREYLMTNDRMALFHTLTM